MELHCSVSGTHLTGFVRQGSDSPSEQGAGARRNRLKAHILSEKRNQERTAEILFRRRAVPSVEKSVMQVTGGQRRHCRSGIVDVDAVLGNIGVKSIATPVPRRRTERGADARRESAPAVYRRFR